LSESEGQRFEDLGSPEGQRFEDLGSLFEALRPHAARILGIER
jgi:hypothetical protein